jgi:hypothetical protein
MRARRKETQSNWRFAIEQIGRELRKLYPPADTPGLRALFTEEGRRASAKQVNDRQRGNDVNIDGGSNNKKRLYL